jgi:hypothetical protein
MTTLREQMLEMVLGVAAAAAGIALFLLVGIAPSEANAGEVAGCAINTCVTNQIFWYCPAGGTPGSGLAYQQNDCLLCWGSQATKGRCAGGNSANCNQDGGLPQKWQSLTVTVDQCFCGADYGNPFQVQASGTPSTDWNDLGRNNKLCATGG